MTTPNPSGMSKDVLRELQRLAGFNPCRWSRMNHNKALDEIARLQSQVEALREESDRNFSMFEMSERAAQSLRSELATLKTQMEAAQRCCRFAIDTIMNLEKDKEQISYTNAMALAALFKGCTAALAQSVIQTEEKK